MHTKNSLNIWRLKLGKGGIRKNKTKAIFALDMSFPENEYDQTPPMLKPSFL